MTRLRGFCIILGLVNIAAGVLAWPLGLGRSAGYRSWVANDYRLLIADGKLEEGEYDHYSSMLAGKLDHAVFGETLLMTCLLIGQGSILTVAGFAKSNRRATPAT
jgi:hypothetical protein